MNHTMKRRLLLAIACSFSAVVAAGPLPYDESADAKAQVQQALVDAARSQVPVVLHGVSLGVGSVDATAPEYLRALRAVVDWIEPALVSDHLCWGSVGGHYAHDLLPLPHREDAIAVAVENVARTQDALRRRILLENVSSYVRQVEGTMPEHEFLMEVARRADCLVLLDVNNIVVNAKNHGFDPLAYVAAIDRERVWQFHLAGHTDRGAYKFDDHVGPVPEEVWSLYEVAVARFGEVPSIVEWDQDVPTWEVLRGQQEIARERAQRAQARAPAASGEAASGEGTP